MAKTPLASLTKMTSKITALSAPAYIALVAYAILTITVLLPFEYPVENQETGKTYIVEYNVSQRLVMVLLMAIPIALSVYSINCMVVGQCTMLSYVISLLTVFWIAMFVILAFATTFRKSA
jgi:hypothetical protein